MISAIGSIDPGNYSSSASAAATSANTQSASSLTTTQQSITQQLDSLLISSISQSGASVAGTSAYPTNIQQATQDQVLLSTNTNLAETLSQSSASASLGMMTDALQTLTGEDGSAQSDQTLTTLASSMQTLSNITNSGTLAANPALAQSLLNICSSSSSSDITPAGSLVNTFA